MTLTPTQIGSDVNEIIRQHGTFCTIRYWAAGSEAYTVTDYDDATLANGSSTVISGGCLAFPLSKSDSVYVQQGLLKMDDMKAYFAGSITLTPNAVLTIGNTGSLYDVLPDNIRRYDFSGVTVYQTAFVRKQPQ